MRDKSLALGGLPSTDRELWRFPVTSTVYTLLDVQPDMPASTNPNRQPSRQPARQPFTTPERAVAYKRVARLRLQRSGGSLDREIVHGVRASAGVLSRIRMIDEVRGLFLTWMICAHSMALIALPAGHPFQYLRPRGWSTIGFVMLTGLALAMVNLRRR